MAREGANNIPIIKQIMLPERTESNEKYATERYRNII